MEQKTDITVNRLPQPTWNRLGVNDTVISDLPADGWKSPKVYIQEIQRQQDATLAEGKDIPDRICFSEILTGMGNELDHIFGADAQAEGDTESDTDRDAIRISGATSESVKLIFTCGDRVNERQDLEIYVPENASLTVWTKAFSDQNAQGTCALRTRIYADRGASVRLVQVSLLGRSCRYINDVGNYCAEDAHVEILQFFLGDGDTWAGCCTTLDGQHSRLDLDVGYSCRGKQLLDMNYVAKHVGKKTESRMDLKGVLRDAGRKTFRGTIDFPVGASGAKGDETEDVLILGEDVVNRTVPLILCAEEDVEGNHGATIGRLSDDILFYMASRGLCESEAEDLIARARIEALAEKIGDDELREEVCQYGK